jgi:hypothetical protein
MIPQVPGVFSRPHPHVGSNDVFVPRVQHLTPPGTSPNGKCEQLNPSNTS